AARGGVRRALRALRERAAKRDQQNRQQQEETYWMPAARSESWCHGTLLEVTVPQGLYTLYTFACPHQQEHGPSRLVAHRRVAREPFLARNRFDDALDREPGVGKTVHQGGERAMHLSHVGHEPRLVTRAFVRVVVQRPSPASRLPAHPAVVRQPRGEDRVLRRIPTMPSGSSHSAMRATNRR